MYYGGYNQGYNADQGYADGQGYGGYPQQQLPGMDAQGYSAYPQQQGGFMPPQQQMYGLAGQPGQGQYVSGYVEPAMDDDDRGASTLKSKKSFSGPPPGAERQRSMSRIRSTRSSRSSHKGDGTGMARHGSVFVANRDRDTQVAISTRGGMSMHCVGDDDEDLEQYYGDMASRHEVRKMDGLRAVKSYRGDIEDGEDVGKPRRVTNRRNVDGRSATGYGGINFKRQAAMRNGEQWGDAEIRTKDGKKTREVSLDEAPPQQQMPPVQRPMYGGLPYMPPMEEGPMVPQIYSKEDVHSYSNMSDAFSGDDGTMEEEEMDL